MSSKRPAPEDEAETSQGAARRLKQRRMDYFYPSATASSLPTTGRTLAIEDDDDLVRSPWKSQLHKHKHPLATENDITRITPLFSKPEFDALIISVLQAAQGTCSFTSDLGPVDAILNFYRNSLYFQQ
ncbi:hypothetical protein BC940DRAFT_320302 [Gongronella butleri]|nr:hypothetical protein BC940DRAFT_320302 [Gongronella butleri]